MSSTPIQTLYTYLNDAGLLSSWTGPGNVSQPAPTVQLRILEESLVPSNERLLLIKQVGGSGSRYVSSPVFVFAILGKVGESAVYAETYANLLYEALLDFDHLDTIISIDPVSPVNGAYKTESGRYAYDMEWSVNVESYRYF